MGLSPFFAKKSGLGSGGLNFFITNLVHLLGLNFPENLSSIGLMVKAVDTFCSSGAVRVRGVIIQKTSAKFVLAFWLGHGWGWSGLVWAWLGLALADVCQ